MSADHTGEPPAVSVAEDDSDFRSTFKALSSNRRPPGRVVQTRDRDRRRQDSVMIEQLTVVDPETRLGNFAGHLDGAETQAVDAALRSVLALD